MGVMCGCGAHNALVDCTCNCDHTNDRLSQWRERALLAESALRGTKHQKELIEHGRETFDVKDRLAVFTYDSHWTGDMVSGFLRALDQTATNLREAGAIAVCVLSSDITLNTLDEQRLNEMGLQRIPDLPF